MESENQVEHNTLINDIREPPMFKAISFSKFKKTEVRNQFIDNMLKGKIEPACYWCAELICAGHYGDVWESILFFIGKYIHIGNLKIISYIKMRYGIFKNIIQQGLYLNELQLRNHKIIRDLFAEIICVLSLSNKKNSFEAIKINRVEEFDITQMTERLKAPTMQYISEIFLAEDPKELFIALNELAYNVSSDCKNMRTACYWVEWIIEFDAICKKRKEQCKCKRRQQYGVDKNSQCDIIWIVWDILLFYSDKTYQPFIIKAMHGLSSLFCIKYSNASCKRRRFILYYAIALLTEQINFNVELVTNKGLVKNVVEKIGEIYKQIKKNEESPNTEYLFSNIETENNFEETVKKLEIMNNMDFISLPNI